MQLRTALFFLLFPIYLFAQKDSANKHFLWGELSLQRTGLTRAEKFNTLNASLTYSFRHKHCIRVGYFTSEPVNTSGFTDVKDPNKFVQVNSFYAQYGLGMHPSPRFFAAIFGGVSYNSHLYRGAVNHVVFAPGSWGFFGNIPDKWYYYYDHKTISYIGVPLSLALRLPYLRYWSLGGDLTYNFGKYSYACISFVIGFGYLKNKTFKPIL